MKQSIITCASVGIEVATFSDKKSRLLVVAQYISMLFLHHFSRLCLPHLVTA
jgi:hypothetical protein